jgi:hypothetical protein
MGEVFNVPTEEVRGLFTSAGVFIRAGAFMGEDFNVPTEEVLGLIAGAGVFIRAGYFRAKST